MGKKRIAPDLYYQLLLSESLNQKEKVRILRNFQPKLQSDEKENVWMKKSLWNEIESIIDHDFTHDLRFKK